MTLEIVLAKESDAAALAALRRDAARDLTARYGVGHWSLEGSPESVLRGMAGARYLLLREADQVLATLRLARSRPWAIDPLKFTPVARPIYLTDMAVSPGRQRQGLGRMLLERAIAEASDENAGAIRLDAYDAPAGAGEFYRRCGFTPRGRVIYQDVPLIYFEYLLLPGPLPRYDRGHRWRFL